MRLSLDSETSLPEDGCGGTLVGRAWVPGAPAGPSPVVVREDGVYDVAHLAPTVAALMDLGDAAARLRAPGDAPRLGAVAELLANSAEDDRDPERAYLLAPVDLQAVKACGVTFAASLLERVIEEQTKGDPGAAEAARRNLNAEIGVDLGAVKPGSAEAARLKDALVGRGLWSQYLEVGIGPDAEVFTKCQPMSAVGTGADVGIHPDSVWNNPEPEVVIVVDSRGRLVGATLGNDVNLRDFEGRSALLLNRAKDNNGSCAIGPFVRLFDDSFTLDDVRAMDLSLTVAGDDGFTLTGASSMGLISRDVEDLVAQTIGETHQYPDGLCLFTGTMFAPTEDRDRPGEGFTHKVGDVVTIRAAMLGALVNRVGLSSRIAPWTFGAGALMRNLSARGLI